MQGLLSWKVEWCMRLGLGISGVVWFGLSREGMTRDAGRVFFVQQ
jgi:hypothetical protein